MTRGRRAGTWSARSGVSVPSAWWPRARFRPSTRTPDTAITATGRLALDAVYPYARDRLHFPELAAEGFQPHKVREVYLIGYTEPDTFVDITGTMDRKLAALRCHASQLKDFADVEARVRERAADLGKPHGMTYAEAFRLIELPR